MRKFSVILPVRNGGHYIKACVNSILTQSYQHFDLLILDNASTDGTLEWISSIKDERVRIFPSAASLSIEENWARIKTVPRNEFMTCIGHDDILEPEFLTVMNELIDRYVDASLFLTHFRYIDPAGQKIRSCLPMSVKYLPQELLSSLLKNSFNITGTGYIMRSSDYDRIGGIPLYPNLLFADFELWLSLASLSFLAVSPGETFAFRIHQSTTFSSANRTMLLAFERLVKYLGDLRSGDPAFKAAIEEHVAGFLHFYCRGLTSRLLRTPLSKREGLTVDHIISKFTEFGRLLTPAGHYDPVSNKTVLMAKLIDSNFLSRKLFLLFKKIYSKPIVG